MDTTADGQPWDERVQIPRADTVAHSEKVGDSSQGDALVYEPASGSGGFLIAAHHAITAAHVLDFGPARGRRKQLSDVHGRVHGVRGVLDQLDEQAAADAPLVLHIEGNASSGPERRPDLVLGNLLIECKRWRDPNAATSGLPKSDGLVPPAVIWDANLGTPWKELPSAHRPLAVRSCCRTSAMTSEVVAAAWHSPVLVLTADSGPELIRLIDCMEFGEAATPLTVTIQDKQLAQDYRQGLRCFVDVVLDVLGRMVVMLMAALSRHVQAPSFLLVMLGATRRYGRRGEPDDHAPLIVQAHPMTTPVRVACLAT